MGGRLPLDSYMLEKTYEPAAVESRIYETWQEAGAFKAGAGAKPGAETFSIVIPPPNVTGSLHIGHALNNTLQDILVRFERMRGKDVLWQPGTDHAGIATQMIVERQLMERQQPGRREMGREKFLERVWEWKAESGGTIMNQLRRLGASADWSRERFTMDEGLSEAVRKVFVGLYEKGLIYRAKRLVNWHPGLETAISDLEVENIETNGKMWHLRYPIEGSEETITVATTRPETMLGDVAVAVHPEDERYKHLIGKHAILPLVGRRIPIVGDEYADPELGSGAVKITPAHDFNDFEVGARHGLEPINIFTTTAKLNDNVPEAYRGLDRFEARNRIVAELEASGVLVQVEDKKIMVPFDEKTKQVVIEPYPHRPVVRERRGAGRSRRSPRCARVARSSCRKAGRTRTFPGWRTSSRGAFRASSGGATRFRRGTGRGSPTTRKPTTRMPVRRCSWRGARPRRSSRPRRTTAGRSSSTPQA